MQSSLIMRFYMGVEYVLPYISKFLEVFWKLLCIGNTNVALYEEVTQYISWADWDRTWGRVASIFVQAQVVPARFQLFISAVESKFTPSWALHILGTPQVGCRLGFVELSWEIPIL